MSLVVLAMSVLVGLLAGLLAEWVMKRGGYGLRVDVILGLVGSLVGGSIFWALEMSPGPWMVPVVVVGLVGAALSIGLQRRIWPAIA